MSEKSEIDPTKLEPLTEQSVTLDRSQPIKPKKPDRITIVEQLYHQTFSYQPTSYGTKFVHFLQSDDQPFSRRIKISEEWTKLDTSWIKTPGLIHIVNQEGKFPHRIPTDEELAESQKKIIEVSFDQNHSWLVFPQESFRGFPSTPELYLRSQYGIATATITVFPQ